MNQNFDWLAISDRSDFDFGSLFSGVPKLMEVSNKVLLLEGVDTLTEVQLDINGSGSEHVSNRVNKSSSDVGAIWNISVH